MLYDIGILQSYVIRCSYTLYNVVYTGKVTVVELLHTMHLPLVWRGKSGGVRAEGFEG